MTDIVIEMTQTFRPADNPQAPPSRRLHADRRFQTAAPRYLIRKRLEGGDGFAKQMRYRLAMKQDDEGGSLRANYFGDSGSGTEPFALLHGRY